MVPTEVKGDGTLCPDSRGVVVIGAGGHAKVVVEILDSSPQYHVVGCTDSKLQQSKQDMRLLGGDSILPHLYKSGIVHAFVGIGDNKIRHTLAESLVKLGYTLVNAISQHAYVSTSARLGCGIAIMPGAAVGAGACIKDHTIINTNASVDHDCAIGEACHIAPGCTLAGNVTIEDGAFLGVGAKVIPNITIGAGSIVGAGATVIRDIPANSVAVGIPARVIKYQY